MIALLQGKIVSKTPDEIIVDVGGVGYHVFTTLTTFERLPESGADVRLHIHTHVREDNISLYGFLTTEEKRIFNQLLKVNGIGPKLGLAILSGVGPHDFVQAVTRQDLARLNAIPGVGRKTAERIILDLKDKLIKDNPLTTGSYSAKISEVLSDALSALVNLGYNKGSAERALSKVNVTDDSELTKIIKNALRELTT